MYQVSSTVKGGTLFPFTVEASGEKYELAATTQQDRCRCGIPLQAECWLPLPISRGTKLQFSLSCKFNAGCVRWVDQLMQASARGSPGASPLVVAETNGSGHLLAPSPLGVLPYPFESPCQLAASPYSQCENEL